MFNYGVRLLQWEIDQIPRNSEITHGTGLSRFAVDGIEPRAAVFPNTIEEVRHLLSAADWGCDYSTLDITLMPFKVQRRLAREEPLGHPALDAARSIGRARSRGRQMTSLVPIPSWEVSQSPRR